MDNYALCRERSMFVENYMTEKVMDVSNYKDKYKVFGGKYTKDGVKNNGRIFEEDIYDRPLCFCGLPCEIRKTASATGRKRVTIIYTCCVKNMYLDLSLHQSGFFRTRDDKYGYVFNER